MELSKCGDYDGKIQLCLYKSIGGPCGFQGVYGGAPFIHSKCTLLLNIDPILHGKTSEVSLLVYSIVPIYSSTVHACSEDVFYRFCYGTCLMGQCR